MSTWCWFDAFLHWNSANKTKSLEDETKLKAGLNASLELQCRETMEIRTKHFRASFEAGFEAGLEGLKPMEIEAKQYDKEGIPFFGPQNVRKSRRAKMGLPSSSFDSQLLLVKSASA